MSDIIKTKCVKCGKPMIVANKKDNICTKCKLDVHISGFEVEG